MTNHQVMQYERLILDIRTTKMVTKTLVTPTEGCAVSEWEGGKAAGHVTAEARPRMLRGAAMTSELTRYQS